MRTITILLVIGLIGRGIEHLVTPDPVRAQTVETANKKLTRTENDLKDAATKTRATATEVSRSLDTPDNQTLPAELREFNRSTDRLVTLRAHLCQDINNYETAYNTTLATFDKESAAVTDAATRRSLLVLRRHTEQDKNDRLTTVRATLDDLDSVLAQGNNLGHAAKCVLIAQDLHQHGEDVDNQLRQAQQEATKYRQTTTSLLTRINQALAE